LFKNLQLVITELQ